MSYEQRRKFGLGKRMIIETREMYEERLSKISTQNTEWITEIVNGNAEQDDIIYQDDNIIVIPHYNWNKIDDYKIHVLIIFTNKNLKTIRDLRNNHIDLLHQSLAYAYSIIESMYHIKRDELKAYFHYPPSTYQLHIHLKSLNNYDAHSSVEYSHLVEQVIYNLSIKSDYYMDAPLFVNRD